MVRTRAYLLTRIATFEAGGITLPGGGLVRLKHPGPLFAGINSTPYAAPAFLGPGPLATPVQPVH